MHDFEASRLHGRPMDKPCARSGGSGLRSIPSTLIRRAIEPRAVVERVVPALSAVLAWCHVQESEVAACYKRVTAA